MALNSLFSFESLLDDYQDNKDNIQIDDQVDLLKDPMMNIIEFASSTKGLSVSLRPVQVVILKLLYGLKLDTEIPEETKLTPVQIQRHIDRGYMEDESSPVPLIDTCQIRFRHPISGIEEGPMSEVEYLKYLREGAFRRTNAIEGLSYKTLVLVIGRRGGKSTLSTIISCYEIYRLLRLKCPQDYYGLKRSAVISVILVGTDRPQSEVLFDDIVSYTVRSPYLNHYLVTHLKSEIEFGTPFDFTRASSAKKIRPTLKIRPVSCNASSIRGGAAIQGIMDEIAHMKSSNSKKASAEEVFKALSPAVATFDDGKMLLISSPNGSSGFFYEFFSKRLSVENAPELCIQAPTWEVNPGRVSDDKFLTDYSVSKNSFYQEYEAKFEASSRAFIEQFYLFERVLYPITGEGDKYGNLPERPLVSASDGTSQYFLSVDQGFKRDGTVISVGHYDSKRDKIIVDFVQKYMPGDPNFSLSNGRLSMKKIVEEISRLSILYKIVKGFFDQHQGSTIDENLDDMGIMNFYQMNMSESLNSEIYLSFERLYSEERLEIPGLPWLVQQFRDLELRSRGGVGEGRKVKVEAGGGAKDDGPDSVSRLVFALYQEMVMGNTVVGDPVASLVAEASYRVVKSLRYNERILRNKMSQSSNRTLERGSKFSASSYLSGRQGRNPKGRR